jgi:hypothetical protein
MQARSELGKGFIRLKSSLFHFLVGELVELFESRKSLRTMLLKVQRLAWRH